MSKSATYSGLDKEKTVSNKHLEVDKKCMAEKYCLSYYYAASLVCCVSMYYKLNSLNVNCDFSNQIKLTPQYSWEDLRETHSTCLYYEFFSAEDLIKRIFPKVADKF